MNDMMQMWASMPFDDLLPIYVKDFNSRYPIETALLMASRAKDVQLLKATVISLEAQEEARDGIR